MKNKVTRTKVGAGLAMAVVVAMVFFSRSDLEEKARTIQPGDSKETVTERLGRPSLVESVSVMMASDRNGGFRCESREDWAYSSMAVLKAIPPGLRHRLLAFDSRPIWIEFDRSNRVVHLRMPESSSP